MDASFPAAIRIHIVLLEGKTPNTLSCFWFRGPKIEDRGVGTNGICPAWGTPVKFIQAGAESCCGADTVAGPTVDVR